MKNLGQMMKQAQQFQDRIAEMQTRLDAMTFDGEAGGGAVRLSLTGKGALAAVKIDPALCVADEVDVLEDLLVAAHAGAQSRLEATKEEEMRALTGGLPLPPGFKMPF